MVRPEKVREVELLTEKLSQATAVVFVDFRGLNVAQAQDLRNRFREADVEYRVVKNTLLGFAAEAAGLEGLDGILEGPTAIALTYDDVTAPASEIKKFSNETGLLNVKGGILEGTFVNPDEVKRLADLPSREELLAQIARCFAAPMVRFASVAQAPMRDLTYVVAEIERQKAG
ncbi:MAG: 50S ribosomal protein L10 [Bacillota bacterium]